MAAIDICEGQTCPECGSMKLSDGNSHGLVKCLNCSHEFDAEEGKLSASVNALGQKYEIDDDQYNLVLIRKTDHKPIYAIEYGNEN